MTTALWKLLVQQGIQQIWLKYRCCAQGVDVCLLEAADPIVFQARALKDFDEGELVLVPHSEDGVLDFAEGKKMRRPRSLHPHFAIPGTVHRRCLRRE